MVRVAVRIGVTAVALAVAVLAGCSTPAPPKPATEAEIAAFHEQQARQWWDSFAFGTPMPDIEVIEVLPAEEAYGRQLECLSEAAIPGVTVNDDGVVTFPGDGSFDDPQFQELMQQQWVCSEQYPVATGYIGLRSPSELAWVYDFYVERYRPCLASLGYELIDFPGREAFVGDAAGFVSWVPHDYSVTPTPSGKQWSLIAARCPLPSLLSGLGLPANGAEN